LAMRGSQKKVILEWNPKQMKERAMQIPGGTSE
jgi:hypothetical protein